VHQTPPFRKGRSISGREKVTGKEHRIADQPRARQLRSSISDRVEVPRYRLITVDRRSFPIAASFIWNSLPRSVQLAPSLTVFRNQLKTFLFRRSFPDIII
jgi:hypothetical protein